MIEKFGHNGWPLTGDDLLGLEENFPADDGLVDRFDVFREPLAFDKAGIKRIGQQAVDEAFGGFLVSQLPDPLHNVGLFVEAGDEFLKGVDNVPAILGWNYERFIAIITGALVSERRTPAPAALLYGLFHAVSGPFAFDIVLKLRKSADNVARQFSDGILFVVLSCRKKANAKGAKILEKFCLIGEVPGQSIQFPDDEGGELLFVLNAILDKVLELGAVLSLGAFAAFNEDLNNIKALIEGKLPTVFFLAFEAIAFLGLFFG